MIAVAEAGRRSWSRWSGQLRSLPILALSVHSACNCRCVMCDIWRANANRREMSVQELAGHRDALRRLRVRRVMLTGGEPLLHRNLWALCDLLRAERIRITLVTTGLLIERHAAAIARAVDDLVISLDGPREVHDAVRRVPGGFDRIAAGMNRLAGCVTVPRTTARSVVQRANHAFVAATIAASREIGFDRVSFLAADVSSTAFNRDEPWTESRRAEITVSADCLPRLAEAIRRGRGGARRRPRRWLRRRRHRQPVADPSLLPRPRRPRRVPARPLQRTVGVGGARTRRPAAPVLLSRSLSRSRPGLPARRAQCTRGARVPLRTRRLGERDLPALCLLPVAPPVRPAVSVAAGCRRTAASARQPLRAGSVRGERVVQLQQGVRRAVGIVRHGKLVRDASQGRPMVRSL